MSGRRWTEKELKTLRKVYPITHRDDLKKVFSNRSWESIRDKSKELGLTKKVIDLSIINTEKKAYILGFLAADGGMFWGAGAVCCRLTLKLSEKDHEHVVKLRDIISPSSRVRTYKRPKPKREINKFRSEFYVSSEFSIAHNKLSKDLIRHGIVPRKTYILESPKYIPSHLIRHWVRGYFDGDGSIVVNNDYPRCSILGYGLENPVLGFISKEFSKHYPYEPKVRCSTETISLLLYTGRPAIAFVNWIYTDATIYLKRKYVTAQTFLGSLVKPPVEYWAKEEEDFLILHYQGIKMSEIAESLGRSLASIRDKVAKLRGQGLIEPHEQCWSEMEVEFLIDSHKSCSINDIAKKLSKSYSSVHHKIKRIGLS